MRIRSRVRRVIAWGLMLVLAVLFGCVFFAYIYITDSDVLSAEIRRQAPRYLPGAHLKIDRVQLRPLIGEVDLKQVSLWQDLDGVVLPMARIPWLRVKHSFWALLHGRKEPSEVVMAQPTLRLKRRRDGTWNLQGLLADPWPVEPMPRTPTVVIQNGRVELIDGPDETPAAVLRDVILKVEPTTGGALHFEGEARGGPFERLRLEGTIDPKTGRLELTRGDLTRLTISEALAHLPADWKRWLDQIRLTSGEIDVALKRLAFDTTAGQPLGYEAGIRIKSGMLNCPHLPFPLSEVEVAATVADGRIVLERAEGQNGRTVVRVGGTLAAEDLEGGPMDLRVEVLELELDERLRRRTPAEFIGLWDEYQPKGRINVALHAVRAAAGGPVGLGMTVTCLDVALNYFLFPYPLEHIRGTLRWQGPKLAVDLETVVGGRPLTGRGVIEDPGPDARVALDFQAEAFPIDEALFKALPPDVRAIVDQFHPSGSVRGKARLRRTPPQRPGDDPIGQVEISCSLDLNPGCAMLWEGMKYPIRNLTGHLELAPDRWSFTQMRGENGMALIKGSGQVRQVAKDQQVVDLHLEAERLPFNEELRKALPPTWRATWATLNPRGSSRVKADIHVEPAQPGRYHLEIIPDDETEIQLVLTPAPGTPAIERGGVVRLPKMEDVRGMFIFDTGLPKMSPDQALVAMKDVRFTFREAPARLAGGTVVVHQDSGQFALGVKDLAVEKLRLDADLRRIMPPVMAQFAQRLDNGQPFRIRGDLGISWSGQPGKPALCQWKNARVDFFDNAVLTGLALEHLQGQIDHIWGRSDGQTIELHGALDLDSVTIRGQQVTRLTSPLDVKDGWARLGNIQGRLLGGTIWGSVDVSLDVTPRYQAALKLVGADLERYARTIAGRQSFRGKLSGALELSGVGSDLQTLQGRGEAHVFHGDLGKLPIVLRLFNALNLSPQTKTAFDSADVAFTIGSGQAVLRPIKFTGNAFSLHGFGTVSLQDSMLDLHLRPLAFRDEKLHIPGLSDATRELGGQIFDIHVTGPAALPKIQPEPLPRVVAGFRRFGDQRRSNRAERAGH